MKKTLFILSSVIAIVLAVFILNNSQPNDIDKIILDSDINITKKKKKKTISEKALYNEARNLYEYQRQVNPESGIIPLSAKNQELKQAIQAKSKKTKASEALEAEYSYRGPSNLGGRTRSLVVDKSDSSGNTIIAGGVSGGVFRTTNGGNSWTKVSANDEIHNVTCITQDPRSGFENTWYYGTGEGLGNSSSENGAFYLGQGIWQSTDGGLNWTQMASTAGGNQESLDNVFDIIFNIEVHPITGDLYAAALGRIRRFNGTSWTTEIDGIPNNTNDATDIVITSTGRVYAAFSGTTDNAAEGIWTSSTGNQSTDAWTRINDSYFIPEGRVVLALAPSNENKLYTLFDNGDQSDCTTPKIEAELWMWDQSNTTYTDYSSKLPDEAGCSKGNDPFAVQGGYNLVVNVKPNNENFVVIGGTNAYKIENITTDAMFSRIGGYASSTGYAQYANHHSDIHALVFNPFNTNILFSGTDGGVHRTDNVTETSVAWTSLNNNYKTYQFYHVAIDPTSGSDFVIGGAQDNGTTIGGLSIGRPNITDHLSFFSGDGVSVAIPNYATCSDASLIYGTQNGNMRRLCQSGGNAVFTTITPRISEAVVGPPAVDEVLYPSQFITYFHVDPDNPSNIYYASLNKVLRTTDGANVTQDTWTDMGDSSSINATHTDEFETFSTTRGAYNSATSYLLMGGNSGHIYRLNDPRNAVNISTAVDITPIDASTEPNSTVTGLAIHPANNDIVLATYSNYGTNSIFLTTNATSSTPTWTLVEQNLSAHSIRSAAIVDVSGEVKYFVGTARGLYSNSNPTTTNWTIESPNDIGFALVSSLSYRPADNHLLIGTHGNGMYEAVITTETLRVDHIDNITNNTSIYPNPVSNIINLKTKSQLDNNSKYIITNISGQSVSEGAITNNQINVSQLTTGIYFITINTSNGSVIKKFIKN